MVGENIVMEGDEVWRKVVYAADCEPCELCDEPICHICDEHYADCDCPGPHMDDVMEYREIDGFLYAREIEPDEDFGDGPDTETE